MKSKHWRKDRYFVREGSRDWIFKTKTAKLIRFKVNPYLREYEEYYSKRRVACWPVTRFT